MFKKSELRSTCLFLFLHLFLNADQICYDTKLFSHKIKHQKTFGYLRLTKIYHNLKAKALWSVLIIANLTNFFEHQIVVNNVHRPMFM